MSKFRIRPAAAAVFVISLSLVSILSLPVCVLSHVSLTFPPARKFSLDYLSVTRSPPPCGMPKGQIKTSFISGSTINVTWHLGYPHRGSHRLELLASNGTELYTLVSENDTTDPTAQRHQVTLPKDFICQDCIIRLLRQSAELENPNFIFWSCGDVDIVKEEEYVETCSGNGRIRKSDGLCGCRSGFWGKRCQYEDECRRDEECNGQGRGKCIDLGGTTLPRRQCFCKFGFTGKKCSRQNRVGKIALPNELSLTDEYLAANYLHQELNKRFNLYWRLIEGQALQIEFVLKVNGTSYAALGWRPFDFDGNCTRYPITESTEAGNSITPPQGMLSRKTRQTRLIPQKKVDEVNEEPAKNQSSRTDDDSAPPPSPSRRYEGLHPMSCVDVVIGAARGNLSRILDYWSGDISTPREDSLWGGDDNIEAATGWETSEGCTTIIFRKKVLIEDVIHADGLNDWPLEIPSFVIWARGQEHGEYVHSLPSGVDEGQPASVPNYYTQDEIKYHGHRGQRGVFTIEFVSDKSMEFFKTKPFN